MGDRLSVTLRNGLPELTRAQRVVTAFLSEHGLPDTTAYLVDMAVEELVSNIIRHGYDAGGEHEIRVVLEVAGGVVDLVIDDDGRPFDPNGVADPPAPVTLEDTPDGGRGILLVRHMAGPLRYERVDGRNVVTLRFGSGP